MPRRAQIRDEVAAIAAAQDGIITSAQLAELGVSRSTTRYRNRMGGMWNRVLPGVHSVTPGPLTPRQRLRAAVLYAGSGALLTGRCVLAMYGVRYRDLSSIAEQVDVLIPHERKRVSVDFVSIERSIRLPEPIWLDGLPVAPLPRAIADVSRRTTQRRDVLALVTDVIAKGQVRSLDLRQELILGPRRGSAFMREALEHADHGSWSGPEADLRSIILESDLPEPLWNPLVRTSDGQVLGILDALYDDLWLGLEVNSRLHHSALDDWHQTLDRSTRLAANGVVVLHFTPTTIRRSPTQVVAQIRQARANLAGRPLPDLVATRAPRPSQWAS